MTAALPYKTHEGVEVALGDVVVSGDVARGRFSTLTIVGYSFTSTLGFVCRDETTYECMTYDAVELNLADHLLASVKHSTGSKVFVIA